MFEIFKHKNDSASLQVLVEVLFTEIRNCAAEQSEVVIALAGGSSVTAFYEAIGNFAQFLEADIWARVKFCLADERRVPLTDPESNYRLLQDNFLKNLTATGLVDADQFVPVPVDSTDPALAYSDLFPRVDIALLGVGEDGHICSLFPHHPSVESLAEGFINVEEAPKLPANRVSMSPELIRNTQACFAFFFSEAKREAWKFFNDDSVSYLDCPAKLVKDSANCYVTTDIN